MLSTRDLQAIRRRLDAATPEPWESFIEGRDHDSGSDFIRTPRLDIYLDGASEADQDFIAHARQDIPRLLNEIERLRKLVDKLRPESNE